MGTPDRDHLAHVRWGPCARHAIYHTIHTLCLHGVKYSAQVRMSELSVICWHQRYSILHNCCAVSMLAHILLHHVVVHSSMTDFMIICTETTNMHTYILYTRIHSTVELISIYFTAVCEPSCQDGGTCVKPNVCGYPSKGWICIKSPIPIG